MSGKGLLIAAVVLLLLAGGVYWARRSDEAKLNAPSDTGPKVVNMAEADVTRLQILKKDMPLTVAEKGKDGHWQITAPQPLRADDEAVNSAVAAVTTLRQEKDDIIDEKGANPGEYGLASPALQVQLTGKGAKTETLQIGDEAPTSGSFYAKLQNQPRIFTVSSTTKSAVDKTSRDLRDKRLLTFNEDKMTRLDLTAKGQTVELGKDNQGDWQILKPRPLRADGGQVDQLLQKLRDAKMDTSVSPEDEKKAPADFASGSRVATVAVTDPSGTQQLDIRKKGDNYYARSSVVEGAYKIASDVAQGLDKGLADLRNKKLFDFGFTEPTRVEVRQGEQTWAFDKSGETWKSNGKTVDSVGVQNVIDKLRDLAATSFPEGGFGTPAIEITVISNAGKRTEKVAFAKSAKGYIARRENEPSLYGLDAKAVDDIVKAAGEVKEAQPPKPATSK